jgi:hypothetical protein
MVHTNGRGADEAHRRAIEERMIHAGDGAHDEGIGAREVSPREGSTRESADLAQGSKGLGRAGNILIDHDAHGRFP